MTNYKLVPTIATREMVLKGARYLRIMSLPEREAASVFHAMSAEAPVVNIVATKNEQGQIVSVTLQDEDHRILEVIAEADVQTEPVEQYNHKRIGWELQRTAVGDGYYGNALRVAKDIPGLTDQDRAVLDRYATGTQHGSDRLALQDIAVRVYTEQQPDPFSKKS